MIIVSDTENKEEVALMERLYFFLMRQPEVKGLSSSWPKTTERTVVKIKEAA